MSKTEEFLTKLEGFLEKEVGGNWYYQFETESVLNDETTLRFNAFSVWGEQFNAEEDE